MARSPPRKALAGSSDRSRATCTKSAPARSSRASASARSTVTPLRPHSDARPVILPPPVEECDDAADVQTLPSQLDHEPEVSP